LKNLAFAYPLGIIENIGDVHYRTLLKPLDFHFDKEWLLEK